MRAGLGLIAGAFASIALIGSAWAAEMPAGIAAGTTGIGEVLVDGSGMTLYTFDEDSSGKSACYEKCAENWPPAQPSSGAAPVGDFVVIDRGDGKLQWAYKGKPLYLWVRDTKPGDTTGDGVRGWQVARP
jgi:predicted lipoprotein with Yx(FWY)xxD motif